MKYICDEISLFFFLFFFGLCFFLFFAKEGEEYQKRAKGPWTVKVLCIVLYVMVHVSFLWIQIGHIFAGLDTYMLGEYYIQSYRRLPGSKVVRAQDFQDTPVPHILGVGDNRLAYCTYFFLFWKNPISNLDTDSLIDYLSRLSTIIEWAPEAMVNGFSCCCFFLPSVLLEEEERSGYSIWVVRCHLRWTTVHASILYVS